MKINLIHFVPFIISFLIGFLLIDLIFLRKNKPPFLPHCFLAGGLGFGLSAFIMFFSFVIFDQLNVKFGIIAHASLLILLTLITISDRWKSQSKTLSEPSAITLFGTKTLILFLLIIPFLLLSRNFIIYFHPLGGWDAWSVWNFKAKFLFLAGEHWQNIFDPILWRSSPHYPLLLPLMTVWGWIFTPQTTHYASPLLIAAFFTLFTTMLLFSSLRHLNKSNFAILAPLLLLTLPHFGLLATSQYCDLLLGYYILASFYCLMASSRKHGQPFAMLAGMLMGMLSFTKPEGMVAAMLMAGLALLHFFLNIKKRSNIIKTFLFFAGGLLSCSVPTLLFHIFYSPGNQTFANSFVSLSGPEQALRWKTICAYIPKELLQPHWGWTWILLLSGLLLSWNKCFRKEILIIPLFLTLYSIIIVIYYFINAHFEITWWLDVSLNRILFSLLPIYVFWLFYSLWPYKKSP